MLLTEELFVYVYVLVHDLILAGAIRIPRRPGPAPACTGAELSVSMGLLTRTAATIAAHTLLLTCLTQE